MSSPQPQSDNNNTGAGSFGHRFKQARVSQGLSLQDAAAELFILCRHLEAIENEDFKQLPQIAFARGFVINYAKYLKLDPVQMAESFNRAYPDELKQTSVQHIKSPLRPMGTLQREGQRSWRINPLLLLGIIGLIALAVILLRLVSTAQDSNKTESVTPVEELSDSEQSAGAALGSNNSINTDSINNNSITSNPNANPNPNPNLNSIPNNGSAVTIDDTNNSNTNNSNSNINNNLNNSNTGSSDGAVNNVGSAVGLNNVGSAIE